MDLKPYLEVKGRDKMAIKDKQAFLTNHLLAFGIAGDEPITNTLKLNEAGIIVDHANPEAQQTWTYEDSKLTIFDEDHETIATFDIKQDENGSLVASSGSMELLDGEKVNLFISELDDLFLKLTSKNILVSNFETGVIKEDIKLNRDFSVCYKDSSFKFWTLDEKSIILYSDRLVTTFKAEILESTNTLELVSSFPKFSDIIKKPKISVVVPVYNAEQFVGQTLISLANQTMRELEFIIVNDGSTDSSIEIINYFAERDTRFKVIDKQNAGVAVAINTGNKIAEGEFFAELDSDDYVSIEMYDTLYDIARNNDVDILKSNVINFTGIGDTFIGNTEKIAKDEYFNRVIDPKDEPIIMSFPIYAWVSLYKRELIIDNDILWNDGVSSYNDNGFYWQTMGLASRVMYINEDFIFHRRDNELSTVKNPEKMERNFFSEHAFIKQDAKQRGTFDVIKPFFFERKINNYFFALNVIPFDKKQDFFQRIAEDFKEDIEIDGLNDVPFLNPNNKQKINEIVIDPNQYFYQVYLNEYYKVSVVVPIHNAEPFLRNTLDNLINQTLKNIEIILIENGSTDGTVDIIKEYANKDPRIVWESIGHSNAGHARNVGLSKAHGKYILFLDADDEYNLELLNVTFKEAQSKNADVVWFNTQEKNIKTGLFKPHTHAFRKSQMPNNRPFSFSEIKENPYDAMIGWPWDKLFKTKYIRGNGWQYQELEVSNDGYFNFLAMSNARRITTVDRILVTRVVEHGNNISSNKHDRNPDAQLKMITKVIKQLRLTGKDKEADAFVVRSIQLINWLFTNGFKTYEGAQKYFDLLVAKGLREIGFNKLDPELVVGYRKPIFDKLIAMSFYETGEYDRFVKEIGGETFKSNQMLSITSFTPDVKKQDHSGRLIFGQPMKLGNGKVLPWFNIVLSDAINSNISAVIDIMYMGNFKPVVKDVLNLSISLQEKEGLPTPTIHQASLENKNKILIDNLRYGFIGNVFTVYSGYIEQYTGYQYNIRMISTREGAIHHSVVASNTGYKENLLFLEKNDFNKFDIK